MRFKLLSIAAIGATMMACSNSNTTEISRVELPGTIDNEAFADCVESISVMNLQMDDGWTLAGPLSICLSDNYIYMLDDKRICLTCLDRQTGEKLSGRIIKGNGPGEIVYYETSMFSADDNICILDSKKRVLQYDHECKFIGIMRDFGDMNPNYEIVHLNSGNYAFILRGNISDTASSILLADKSFNITSWHFNVPQVNYGMTGGDPCYLDHDTIRLLPMSNNILYTLYGDKEQCTELALPNPMTPEIYNDLLSKRDFDAMDNYNSIISLLSGSGKYLTVWYTIDDEEYMSIIDKYTNKAVSVHIDLNGDFKQASDILSGLVPWLGIMKSDGKYAYARCQNSLLALFLEGHDDILDARLQKTQAEYHAYLERNAEYIKDLTPDERNAAIVWLKIKLKD
ncbi:MAG: 6-bladed beta-propeller [Salinivirgaceae bacterium]|nr:6-bladed beta-propeller [Salinivirgaceae bacterium]